MNEYHKINTVFKRNPSDKHKSLIVGDFSIPEFEYLKNNDWIFTEKVDGTNIRIIYDGSASTIKFGGKTENAQIPATLVEKLQERFFPQITRFKEKFGEANVCLYGEGYGCKIQSGGKYRNDTDFVLFDVLIDDWWLQRENIEDIAKYFALDVVPIVGRGTFGDLIDMVKNGFKSSWGDFIAEGIVARPATELRTRAGDRIITKIKHKDFTR